MCGRFTLATPAEVLVELLGLGESIGLVPRYNIAPSQPIAAVGRRDDQHPRKLALLTWGFRPGGPSGTLLINARAETVERTSAFRDAFRYRRCLVPADGFYEWKRERGHKQAFHIARIDGRPFAFAGLWEAGRGPKAPSSCVLLTTQPNAVVSEIHERMPVVLPAGAYEAWLDPRLHEPALLKPWLVPAPAEEWVATPVGPRVNDVRNDDPACLAPA